MKIFCISLYFLLILVVQMCKCLTIRNEEAPKDDNRVRTQEKTKSKKSVETLYTIEKDLNRKKHYIDEYAYYVPEKYVKPHYHERPEFSDQGEVNSFEHEQPPSNHKYQQIVPIIDTSQLLAQQEQALRVGLASNPILAALFLSQTIGLTPAGASGGFNHPAHLPINPYVALLLSHYGRYVQPAALGRHQRGIYGYTAANNYHNNKPFGAYKIYEDAK